MIKNLMEYITSYSKNNKLQLVWNVIEPCLAYPFLRWGVIGNHANLMDIFHLCQNFAFIVFLREVPICSILLHK